MSGVFGRTNAVFPQVWLSLGLPEGGEVALNRMASLAADAATVLDITPAPALWGGLLPREGVALMACGGAYLEHATSQSHAADLTSAHLIELLSALQGAPLTFYFLRVRNPLEEAQIGGALEALEVARQDGLIGYLGLESGGHPLTALGLWQFHDAFEAILTGAEGSDVLLPIAHERRVGAVVRDIQLAGAVTLRRVRSLEDLVNAFGRNGVK